MGTIDSQSFQDASYNNTFNNESDKGLKASPTGPGLSLAGKSVAKEPSSVHTFTQQPLLTPPSALYPSAGNAKSSNPSINLEPSQPNSVLREDIAKSTTQKSTEEPVPLINHTMQRLLGVFKCAVGFGDWLSDDCLDVVSLVLNVPKHIPFFGAVLGKGYKPTDTVFKPFLNRN
ncbi:hypothetical protein VTL71DRAFT_12740 [Oculimacula yallundae]|uniref:Uncharacterized protein n=1 Tax=Oculimacula yallundae TaxID=86028 RepID=A0ABR4CNM7_9HELO